MYAGSEDGAGDGVAVDAWGGGGGSVGAGDAGDNDARGRDPSQLLILMTDPNSSGDCGGCALTNGRRAFIRDAAFANRYGFSKHRPALPLYTEADARAALPRLTPVEYGSQRDLGDGLTLTFLYAGHNENPTIGSLDIKIILIVSIHRARAWGMLNAEG